ncbi:hypothetical protein EXM65_14360 [Clostridium botulinum]|uniref:Uncharacterized protein n=1 Tax=Clostridium botulinum TaxID=1491 RepID=A0A6M0SQX9_CLOBO|nr:hypothetical protein [Clostridium botulinum]
MIMYKLNEINERIAEKDKNIKSILEKGENTIQADIQKYRAEKGAISTSKDLTEAGKEKELDKLSYGYYDKCVANGKILIQQISDEYDSAIERVKELKQFDDERKIVTDAKTKEIDVIKANTNLMYAAQVLNNIDKDYGHEELKNLLEHNQESEKIITLIKMKAYKLKKDNANSPELNDIIETINKLNIDYVEQLENKKVWDMEYYNNKEYPRIINRIPIKELFEVDKADIRKFDALNRGSKEGINRFIAK